MRTNGRARVATQNDRRYKGNEFNICFFTASLHTDKMMDINESTEVEGEIKGKLRNVGIAKNQILQRMMSFLWI